MEIPCNSSATSSGSNPTLECNDFCAKILRNRRLASALDIQRDEPSMDPSSSSGQPPLSAADLGYYDDSIRNFYMENIRWCKQMEKQLIDFAQDSTQTSLHFKPMRAHFRWFLHTYATHFNLGTEAMDPEPYRSVAARKNIGQCRVPPILLSQAIRDPTLMAQPPASEESSSAAAAAADVKPDRAKKPPVNAIQLIDLAFGTLQEDIDNILRPVLDTPYTTQWGKEGDTLVILPDLATVTDMETKETMLWQWKKALQSAFLFNDVAGLVECCWVNQAGEITWSQPKVTTTTTAHNDDKKAHAQRNRFGLLDMGEEEGPTTDSDGQVTTHQDNDDDSRTDEDWIAIANDDVISDS